MLKMPISVSDLNDEHLPMRPRGHVETTHQKKKRDRVGNASIDEQCAVCTLSCYGGWYSPGQNGQHLWYKCMEQNGLLVGMPTCSAETLLIKFSLLTGCTPSSRPILGPIG